ncbi:hypothetical protein [Nocardioides sp. cx-173]|uniref:hypothetical protein n=1 Tax=Nocardioides sp. cx-173 TaxID=2898796 RepID=UPI001E64AAD3|nr:hypothetical protein [Nocardioides sp. cx-173]MCD4527432.1 hypothetical protein [Nocardioides sp. cx-173]UGB41005.1 hypothetical protein LQ940_16725 [Nocardioides sp. cx-173]
MVYVALAVSAMALCFTVGSFWWLHARSGPLVTYEPGAYAASVSSDVSGIRLPLALHNTGAAAVVVLALRMRFTEHGETLDWDCTRKTLELRGDDVEDAPRPFSISGRSVHEFIPEFVGTLPGVVPEPRAYRVMVEARTSHREGWTCLLAFDLQFGNLVHPRQSVVYSNRADYLDEQQRADGAKELHTLRREIGRTPNG